MTRMPRGLASALGSTLTVLYMFVFLIAVVKIIHAGYRYKQGYTEAIHGIYSAILMILGAVLIPLMFRWLGLPGAIN